MAGVTGFLKLFPECTATTAALFNFRGGVEGPEEQVAELIR